MNVILLEFENTHKIIIVNNQWVVMDGVYFSDKPSQTLVM